MAVAEIPETTVIQPGPILPPTSEPKAKQRDTWGGKSEFLLSAVGYAVGLGNVWRFPHLCYIHGGGAFLIPYALMLAFIGLPLFFLELAWGQYGSLGTISTWGRCVPLFKGVGYCMITVNLIVSIYYNVIISYTLFYFFASFTRELPWSNCNNTWNTASCVERQYHGDYILNITNATNTSDLSSFNHSDIDIVNAENGNDGHISSPAEEYWDYYVLGLRDDINIGNLGSVRWHLSLCLLLAWIIVFCCIIQGIKSSGKVVYFTATFPYIVLLVLMLRGVTLPGAGKGITFYLTPNFKKMGDAKVWSDAAVQIMYSLGVGFGSLLTMGSYNKFNNNCCRDAITIALINCGTSIFAGFVIFSVLGFMSQNSGIDIKDVAESGAGLAFIAYPEALAMMPGAPFWSLMFFFMLFTLGLDSQFASLECIITGIVDEFQFLARYKKYFTGAVCLILFLLGLPCVTQGGIYILELLDKSATSLPLLVAAGTEVLCICWIYGWKKFSSDLESMMGFRPNYYWLACWMVMTPAILVFILIFHCIEYEGMEYNGYIYPEWANAIGWFIVTAMLLIIPIGMIAKVWQKIGGCQDLMWIIRGPSTLRSLQLQSLLQPSDKWGPALDENKRRRIEIDEKHVVRYSADSDTARIVDNGEINEASEQNMNNIKEDDKESDRIMQLTSPVNYTAAPEDSYI